MLPRQLKLRSRKVFQASMMHGHRLAWGQYVTLIGLPLLPDAALNARVMPQLGVVVSKKLAKQAVQRNLMRRRYADLLTRYWPELHLMLGFHYRSIIAVVRPIAKEATFAELAADMATVIPRLKKLTSHTKSPLTQNVGG